MQQQIEVMTAQSGDDYNLDDEQTDKMVIGESDEKVSKISVTKTRQPKCTKCRNHDLTIPKKNHKGICPFESCTCPKCRNIDERRHVLKNQVRIRRHLDQKEKVAKDRKHEVCRVDSHITPQQILVQIPDPSVTFVSMHSPLPSFSAYPYPYSQLTYLTDSLNEESVSTSNASQLELRESSISISELYENNLDISQTSQESNVYYNDSYNQYHY